MSKKIGVVSEGVSDYRTIKHITERFLKSKDGDEYFTIRLNPKEEHLIVEALKEECECVIVQIDTDVCEEYKVKRDLSNVESLWNNVRDKILESVHPDFDESKLILAICIEELECWLIPFIDNDSRRCMNMDRCLNIVNNDIHKENLFIAKDAKNSLGAQRAYEYILKQKRKPKEIVMCSEHNYGFKKFIEQLAKL